MLYRGRAIFVYLFILIVLTFKFHFFNISLYFLIFSRAYNYLKPYWLKWTRIKYFRQNIFFQLVLEKEKFMAQILYTPPPFNQ